MKPQGKVYKRISAKMIKDKKATDTPASKVSS